MCIIMWINLKRYKMIISTLMSKSNIQTWNIHIKITLFYSDMCKGDKVLHFSPYYFYYIIV